MSPMRGTPAAPRVGLPRRLDEAVSDVWQMHDVGWGWWLLMSVGMVAFWTLVIYGVFWLARNTGSQAPDEGARESPEEVLKRRLAAGEISVDECERLRRAMADGEPVEPRAPALA
jgi:putative membrane protein